MDKYELVERYEALGDESDFLAARRLFEQDLTGGSSSRLTPVSTSLVCDDPRLIDTAEQLLGGPVIPQCPEGVLYFAEAGWHTDDGIGVRGVKSAAYFGELTAGTGALRLVPGSHHSEERQAGGL